MLRNGRNFTENYGTLIFFGCSCHNAKQVRRRVKKTAKRREERTWRKTELDN